MSVLKEFFETRRGIYRAYFKDKDLGQLALPPEIKSDYDSAVFMTKENGTGIRESYTEIFANISLHLKSVIRGFNLLDSMPLPTGELILKNPEKNNLMELNFPLCQLLPIWNFSPSFTGDHHLTLKFKASVPQNGKLFYFSCA